MTNQTTNISIIKQIGNFFGKQVGGIFGKTLALAFLFVVMAGASYAQICLLDVGDNCPQGGRKYLDGAQAAELLRFINYGSRYLLVLSSAHDPNTGCNAEIRAWVSAVEAQDNNGRISVKYGKPRTVQVCNGSPTAQQINNGEAYIQYSRKWIAELQTNPTRYTNAQAWINHYDNYIRNQQALIAQVTP